MADFLSDQLTQLAARTFLFPISNYGKLRTSYFSFTATGASTTPNTYDMFKLPPGRVRVLPVLSRISSSAWGASRVLDLGNRAYLGEQRATIAQVANEFIAALSIASAVAPQQWSTTLKKDFFSMAGITVFGTVSGGDQAASDSLSGFCIYATE